MKKITLAAVILCVLLLFSCNNEEAGIGGESDMATDAAASEYIVLAEDGKSAVIIRPDEATENVIDAAVSLRRSLESRYGISLTLQTDWLTTGQSPAEDAVEIVVGFTNRSGDIESDLSARTFRITTKGSRVFVYGSSDIMTKNAVAYLLGKESPLIFEDGVLKIPADTDIVVTLDPKAGGTPKTILIVVDGLRPDALAACGNKFVDELLSHSIYTLDAKTVMPSVTLPSHMSLFHSVPPERHGILTNTYVPMVRPINGICEVLRAAGKASALFYDWEELKDLSRPDSLAYANYVSGHIYGYEKATY